MSQRAGSFLCPAHSVSPFQNPRLRRYVFAPPDCLNAQYDSGYNVPYFISKHPARDALFYPLRPTVATFPFLPARSYFSRGKLGYLVARIAAVSTPSAHTNGGRNGTTGDPVAPGPFSSFPGFLSPDLVIPTVRCPRSHFHLLFCLSRFCVNLVEQCLASGMKADKKARFLISFRSDMNLTPSYESI